MAEEKTEKAEKAEKAEKETGSDITNKLRENPWIISTIVIGVFALVMLFFLFRGGVTGNVISESSIGEQAVTFINSQVLQGQANVTLDSVSSKNGLYEVMVNYNNQKVPVYFTEDGQYYLGTQIVPTSLNASATTQTQAQAQTGPVDIPIGNSPVLGNANAKLTIVEISDFSCPYCGAASGQAADMVAYMKQNDPTWEPAVPGIIKDYVNTGKAKLVYKYSMGHSGGHSATLVAWCLNDQNLFWKFHDKAFANQADVENLDKMKTLAQSIGADITKLNSCLDSKKYDSKFAEDEALGQSIGIGGTPAIYANGIKVANGAESYTKVKAAIEAVLAQAA